MLSLGVSLISTNETDYFKLGQKCTEKLIPGNPQRFWVEDIKHEGTAPFNVDPVGYQVYRNVKDFGAKGDGITNDTQAINSAISAGFRCGRGCDSTTIQPALVYFPSGKYLISSPIIQYYYTQLVGDAINPPVLLASENFAGMAMIDSNPYIEGGANWYTNQNNFYRQIRNIILDMTNARGNATGIHWQVAQATSLTNLEFRMAKDGRNHQGIFMENGSGGFMSDLVFDRGKLGMFLGNQQFTYRNITIKNAETAIQVIWNWGFTLKDIKIINCGLGLDMSSGGSGSQQVGSLIIVDSSVENTKVFLKTATTQSSQPHTSGTLLLDNISLSGVDIAIQGVNGTLLAGVNHINSWGQGQYYNDKSGKGSFYQGELKAVTKSDALTDSNGAYFSRPKPQYQEYGISDFISVKSLGAKGDGKTDDTSVIQKALTDYANCKILYFPAGVYLITSTVFVPSGTKMVGETWSTLSATGNYFADMKNPTPMLKIGNKGDLGDVEISDMLFSTAGQAPGAVLVEWNIRDAAGKKGSCGMWDSHFRIGGALGTNLDSRNCDKAVAKTSDCKGSHTLLRLSETSSAYLENVWVWVADHDLDNNHNQISLFNGRGIVIESQNGPVWLYGTASEHSVLYQYNIVNAKNILMAMIQTETPYFQSVPMAPEPFTSEVNDPDFSKCNGSYRCAMAWGLIIKNSQDIYLYGAGLYNFFQNYNQSCLNSEDCQQSLVDINSNSSGVYIFNLNTKAAIDMISVDEKGLVEQVDDRNSFCSTIAGFMPFSQSKLAGEVNFEFFEFLKTLE